MVFAVTATGVAERHDLPAGRRLVGKRGGREPGAAARPEIADVRAGVRGALVVPDAGDEAVDIGAELDAELDGAGVARVGDANHRRAPQAARAAAGRGVVKLQDDIGRQRVAGDVLDARVGGAAAEARGVDGVRGQRQRWA